MIAVGLVAALLVLGAPSSEDTWGSDAEATGEIVRTNVWKAEQERRRTGTDEPDPEKRLAEYLRSPYCERAGEAAGSGAVLPCADVPPDDELPAFLAASSAELEAALDGAEPAEPVWTWAPRRDVAFVLRRQVVEALVHTADVELLLDDLRPIPPDVALDAIDEWLEIELPAALPDGPPEGAHPVVLHAVDADAERTLFPGTRPFPIAVLTGNAGDLLLALWRRLGIEVLTVDGDPATAAAMLNLVTLE